MSAVFLHHNTFQVNCKVLFIVFSYSTAVNGTNNMVFYFLTADIQRHGQFSVEALLRHMKILGIHRSNLPARLNPLLGQGKGILYIETFVYGRKYGLCAGGFPERVHAEGTQTGRTQAPRQTASTTGFPGSPLCGVFSLLLFSSTFSSS